MVSCSRPMGRCGPDGHLEQDGHAVADAAVDAAAVVGAGLHLAVLHIKGVVGLTASHSGEVEASPKGKPLDSGYGEQVLRQHPFHVAAQIWGTYPHRQSQDGALDGAADGVQLLPRLQNLRLHGRSCLVVNGGEGFFGQSLEQGRGQFSGRKGGILYSAYLADMGTHSDAPLGQKLLGHGAGEHQRGGQAAEKWPPPR